ncbi:MAG: hypothetical protein IJ489_00560 [Clostridia bacterium]|nr:hypothetical protein [Clostridia bacterium]
MTDSELIPSEEINEHALMEIADGLLFDARAEIVEQNSLSVPIAELATLGIGVSSLLPALRTVTQTTTINTTGLYQLANQAVGDTLKVAKNGNFWGAYKTSTGASKFAQLQPVGPLSATTASVAAINPATMMMAVALFSIEQKLGEIEEMQNQINSTLKDLQKKFKYYRLSLYTFSMASMMEIMLSGNFKEDYIDDIKEEIEKLSFVYRDLFAQCSIYLEKISKISVETNLLKGIGTASKAVGKFIGSIPFVKEGQVDEFLQDSAKCIKSNAKELEMSAISVFSEISNPETRVFIDRMEDMIRIYNHTEKICFDDKKIYLIAK